MRHVDRGYGTAKIEKRGIYSVTTIFTYEHLHFIPKNATVKVLNLFIFHHPGTQHQRDASARYVVRDAAEWADHGYHDFFHPNVAVPWFFSARYLCLIKLGGDLFRKWIVYANDICT